MIIFENIDTGETVGVSRETGGKFYRSQLAALVNSSNMSINADRGQDFGWRLAPEQQALIEEWEQDPDMIDKVSSWSKVMVDQLTHSEFLSYLLYQQELGKSTERTQDAERRGRQAEYEARVAALRVGKPQAAPAFDPAVVRGEATIEDFLDGKLDNTGLNSYSETSTVSPADIAKVLAPVTIPTKIEVQSTPAAAVGIDVTPAPKTVKITKPTAKK